MDRVSSAQPGTPWGPSSTFENPQSDLIFHLSGDSGNQLGGPQTAHLEGKIISKQAACDEEQPQISGPSLSLRRASALTSAETTGRKISTQDRYQSVLSDLVHAYRAVGIAFKNTVQGTVDEAWERKPFTWQQNR